MTELKRIYPTPKEFSAEITRPEQPDRLGRGVMEGDVNRVNLELKSRTGRVVDVDVAEKVLRRRNIDTEARCADTMIRHQKLKILEIPTVPYMMTSQIEGSDRWSLIMPDLTKGGKVHCISATDFINSQSYYSKCGKVVRLTNSAEVSQQLTGLVTSATEHGVVLGSSDVYFLLINKETGKGKVIAGDLGNVYFQEDYGPDRQPEYQRRLQGNLVGAAQFAQRMNEAILAPGNELQFDEQLLKY